MATHVRTAGLAFAAGLAGGLLGVELSFAVQLVFAWQLAKTAGLR